MFMYLNCSKPYYSTLIMIMKVQIYYISCETTSSFTTLLFFLSSPPPLSPPLLPSSSSPSPPPPSTYTHPHTSPSPAPKMWVCELITVAMAALQGMSLSSAVRSLLITIIWRYVSIGATCMCPLVLHISRVYTGGGGGGGGGVIEFEQPPVLSPKRDRLHH